MNGRMRNSILNGIINGILNSVIYRKWKEEVDIFHQDDKIITNILLEDHSKISSNTGSSVNNRT